MYISKKSVKRVSLRSIVPYSISLFINRPELLVLEPGEIVSYDLYVDEDKNSSGYNLDYIDTYIKNKTLSILYEEVTTTVSVEDTTIVTNPNTNTPQLPPIKISTDIFKTVYLDSIYSASVTTYANSTYNWVITNGIIESGQGTFSIRFRPLTANVDVIINCTVTSPNSVIRNASVNILAADVLPAIVPITISINPSTISLTQNTSTTLTATVTGTLNTDVLWHSTGGTITGTGNTIVYKAPNVEGTYTVSATSMQDNTKIAHTTVTCTKVKVSLLPADSQAIQVLDTIQYTALVEGTANKDVVWTVDNVTNGNLTVGTIIGSGNTIMYMAPYFIGAHTIKATSVADSSKNAASTITCINAPVLDVFVFPDTISMQTTTSIQLTATVTVGGPGTQDVTWKVNGISNGNATVGTIVGSGNNVIYTAPIEPGTYRITASSILDPTKYFTSIIECVPAPVVGVTLVPSGSATTPVEGLLYFDAVVINAEDTSVVWKVNNIVNGNATVGTITAGVNNAITYTAPETPGVYTIAAYSVADPTKYASTTIVCTAIPLVITISPKTANVILSDTLEFSAIVTGTGSHDLIWSVDGVVGGNSVVGTINEVEGSITYVAPDTEGVHTVTATSAVNPAKFDSATITCTAVVNIQVTLTPSTLQSIPVMSSIQFTANVTGTSNTMVTWTVDDIVNGNATVGTITSFSGNTQTYTAPSTGGQRVIKVTSVADPTKTASTTVDCQVIPITVNLTPATTTITVEETAQLTAVILGSGSHEGVWDVDGITNGNGTVGTITGTGNTRTYTPPEVVGTNNHTVTVTSVEDPTKSDSSVITCNGIPISVSLIPANPAAIEPENTLQFTAIVTGTGSHDVTWTVDDISNGNSTVGTITGSGNTITYTAPVTEGTYVVKATSTQDNTKNDTTNVTVAIPLSFTISGFGANTIGGLTDVHVTNLNDSGTGSLRDAIVGGGKRVIFDVGGEIALATALYLPSNTTIDATSAPSPGITFTGHSINLTSVNNIILRNFRHKGGWDGTGGGGGDPDCISIFTGSHDIVLDHLSLSGSYDECLGIYGGNYDITVQNCIIGNGNPAGERLGTMASNFGSRVTYYHNLHEAYYRNPAIGNDVGEGTTLATEITGDVVNNVIWDFATYGTTVYHGAKANVVGNYYSSTAHPADETRALEINYNGQAYASGNYMDGTTITGNVGTAFDVDAYAQITASSAADALTYVTTNVGCRVGGLDTFDQAIIDALP